MADIDELPEAEEIPADAQEDEQEGQDGLTAEQPEGEAADEGQDGDEIVIDVQEEPEETPVIRTMRRKIRDLEKELKAKERANAAPSSDDPGPRPTLEALHYDEEKFAEAVTAWTERKREFDAKREAEAKDAEEMQQQYHQALSGYDERKAGFAHDFDEAEDAVKAAFGPVKFGMMIDAAKRQEVVVYALGKNPDRLAKLAEIKNPIRFAAEIARLEGSVKMNSTPKPTPPEKRVAGTGVAPKSSESLERLRAQAQKTGDYTAYFAAKKAATS